MICVTIHIRTVSEANAHTHWRARQRRAKEQRNLAGLVLLPRYQAWLRQRVPHRQYIRMLGSDLPGPLAVTLTRIAPRALDSDNLAGSLKHVRDGVADALGIDDRDPRVTWAYAQRRGKPKEYAVEIRIEAREPLEATPRSQEHGAPRRRQASGASRAEGRR